MGLSCTLFQWADNTRDRSRHWLQWCSQTRLHSGQVDDCCPPRHWLPTSGTASATLYSILECSAHRDRQAPLSFDPAAARAAGQVASAPLPLRSLDPPQGTPLSLTFPMDGHKSITWIIKRTLLFLHPRLGSNFHA